MPKPLGLLPGSSALPIETTLDGGAIIGLPSNCKERDALVLVTPLKSGYVTPSSVAFPPKKPVPTSPTRRLIGAPGGKQAQSRRSGTG
jgi:hypothetical protein